MTKLPSNFLIYTEKPTQYVWALFNLTQPKQVATNDANNSLHGRFQSNATRVGCNSKLAQTKQQVVMHFVQCLSVF